MAEKALALWLADALELHYAHLTAVPEINRRAAAELRRLHEENTKLAQLLADTHDVSADLAETSDALHRTLQQRDELLEALKASVDSFCSYCCPSVWKTADGRPHSEQCKANRAAIAKAEGA